LGELNTIPMKHNVLFLIFTILFTPSFSQIGSLDTSFDPISGADDRIRTICPQSDNKILIGGDFQIVNGQPLGRIARLTNTGEIDMTFNAGYGANSRIMSIDLQSSGKIIAGGYFTDFSATTANRIIRLNVNGSIDNTFMPGTAASGNVWVVKVQSDDKIMIGGEFVSFNGTPVYNLARLNSDGTLDATFSVGTGVNGSVRKIAIQDDGKYIIGGSFSTVNGITRNNVARLNADGTVDLTFNPGSGPNSAVEELIIQNDGKIIVGGLFTSCSGNGLQGLARLNQDGSLDATFEMGTGFSNFVTALYLSENNEIIVGGGFTSYNGTNTPRIVALDENGLIIPNYVFGTGFNALVDCIVSFETSKLLVGGSFTTYNGITRNRIAMLNAGVTPLINVASSFNTFAQTLGNPSAEQSFTVSGSDLTDHITVTAPSNYEVSLSSGSGFASSVQVNQTSGTVPTTTIYVRLNAGAVGAHNGDITLTSGALNEAVAVTGNTTENTSNLNENTLSQLSIFPNPGSSLITLAVNQPTTAVFMSTNGAILANLELNGETSIDVSSYASGVYFIRTAEGQTVKFIKH
jgi:uncharacterized delta-60 repeat protein